MKFIPSFLLTFALCFSSQIASGIPIAVDMTSKQVASLQKKISSLLTSYPAMFSDWESQSERKVKLVQVKVRPERERVELYFSDVLAQIAIREPLVLQWEQMVRDTLSQYLNEDYSNITVAIYSRSIPIERFIPNVYRQKIAQDAKRKTTPYKGVPLTQNISKGFYGKGLSYRHIALWPGHGAYYSAADTAWIWQRPALFGHIEDLNNYEYCYRYLIPMLENAGAVVVSARERAIQEQEFIVNDNLLKQAPFTKIYSPKVAARGVYGVSVRYNATAGNLSNVTYKIHHLGGVSEVRVNQRIGGGMWVYIGEFDLDANSTIELIGKGEGSVTSTGIRIGGGMGDIERGGSVSGAPRWAEAARYSMQYNGVPDRIYAQQTIEDNADKDYVDDYKSRGDWVNWVVKERHIPIDAALAFHTNAGVNDSIFGTLTIHYTEKGRGEYSNGKSKFMGRELADILLSEIVGDIWAKYTPKWTRRSLYDKSYAEISRPDVPAAIVELFSHQNERDVLLGNSPEFRFTAARSIYKGVLKYLSSRYSTPYVVQPLPVHDFMMSVAADTAILLQWKPSTDSLEATAVPISYKVYTRLGDGTFDNGRIVHTPKTTIPILYDGVQRSYKITAINEGGESFGSQVLSCGFLKGAAVVSVENECRPLSIAVPYVADLGYVGAQYDFDPMSQFIDNNNPGFGASATDKATIGLDGENFDNTIKKGAQVLKNGNSYVSLPSSIKLFTK